MEIKDRITQLEAFYESIMLLDDKEEIEKALPNAKHDNFEVIMKWLIEKLRQEKENIVLNEKKFSKKEIDLLVEPEKIEIERKINICNELLNKEKKEKDEEKILEEKSEEEPVKHLIFATTSLGNICVEEDLKDIPMEFYDRFYECLYETEQNIKNGNTKKGRIFSNNKDLEGIIERKGYQVRVCYRHFTSAAFMSSTNRTSWEGTRKV